MYLFISIILIAELIIATALVCQIRKLDRRIVEINGRVSEFRPQLESGLAVAKESVAKVVLVVKGACEYLKMQREKWVISIVENILIFLLIYLLKGKRKKYVSAVQLVFALKDFWNS